MDIQKKQPLSHSFLSGAVSGVMVDVVLFPLDTIKTRLQSHEGLLAIKNFRGLYSGISSTLIGSAPSAALFFVSYESVKRSLRQVLPEKWDQSPLVFISAAVLGEIAACSIRVPAEVLKQRMQVHHQRNISMGLREMSRSIYKSEGVLGLYRGFQATIQREIPFACIQYPLFEYLKIAWKRLEAEKGHEQQRLEPWKGALCGSIAGGFTGFLTTPLDVIKTRIMLAESLHKTRPYRTPWHGLQQLFLEGGVKTMFSGAGPRTLWISVGGFLFFGAYEKSSSVLEKITRSPT